MPTDRKYGILVAPEGKRVRRSKEMVLDSDIPQFKYSKTVLLERTVPLTAAHLTTNITFVYAHGLGYIPAYSTYVRGYNGRWGRISKGVQSVGFEGWVELPQGGTETINSVNYTLNYLVFNDSANDLPQHQILIRLTLLFDGLDI